MDQLTNNDIDSLLQKAKTSGDKEDLATLWKAALNLPQWHFITKHTEKLEDRRPFIGVLDNQPWVFVFTDRQKAQEFGQSVKDGGFVDDKGSVMIISMDTHRAIDYVTALSSKGVFGVRINELNGWFSPIANLPAIINHVTAKD
ncbi:hypothetical protein [Hymenobacter koreensis]|uniref:SseB family protein n=1 Tax=Hymenobacter koreensis TaxID=1084523 RepID=A0ABP8IUL8_9BACT